MKNRKVDNKVVAPEIKLDLSILKKAKKYSLDFQQIDNFVDAKFVKQLREKLNMSQTFFAEVFGVSKKTIEKWEQGANPVSGMASRLLYIVDQNPDIMKLLYTETITTDEEVKVQSEETRVCMTVSVFDIENPKSDPEDFALDKEKLNTILAI